ncbi:hypothetical protein FIBSPDRAFT_858474 [Athelia psychrophila]|uniref:Uncharacterized protein n=1 Tax=Athelia psychrophila TaxID=1759441 RepID=A0A166M0R4_9AGAM|nr:hypothetical protein FIBSPDRAFT_858474 [Fibularhizoctonia sp. CBS 109695]
MGQRILHLRSFLSGLARTSLSEPPSHFGTPHPTLAGSPNIWRLLRHAVCVMPWVGRRCERAHLRADVPSSSVRLSRALSDRSLVRVSYCNISRA